MKENRTLARPWATWMTAIAMALGIGCMSACASSGGNCADGNADAAQTQSIPEASVDAASSQTFGWSVDSDCSPCHVKQAESATDASYQLCTSHSSLSCISCHTDEEGLAQAHADVRPEDTKGAKKLKKTAVEDSVCLSCHENDYTPEATAHVTVLADKNGTAVNPHALPDTATHEEKKSCANCHDMHSDKSIEDAAVAYCRSCHHKDVYECNTCHEL